MSHQPEFKSLDRVSSGIQYTQMLIARISALFLMLSLITATWNLLIKDALFAALPWLEWIWGLAQAVAVDSALAVVFVRMAESIQNKQRGRGVVYGIVGLLLLFVAWAIVDVESLRQALDITLTEAAGQLPFHISIEFLTQMRSVAVVLLIAVSGFEFVVKASNVTPSGPGVQAIATTHTAPEPDDHQSHSNPTEPVVVSENTDAEKTSAGAASSRVLRRNAKHNGHSTHSAAKLAEFYALQPDATVSQAIIATGFSQSTVSRWRKRYGSQQFKQLTVGVGERTN